MAEQTLKQSILQELHLPMLTFRADYRRFDPAYAEFLEIKITEVYGSSATPRVGDNYLICGEYTLKEHKPVKARRDLNPWLVKTYGKKTALQVVTLFAGAAGCKSAGVEAFLLPGSGEFAANLLVQEVLGPGYSLLVLMIDSDRNAIDILLQS